MTKELVCAIEELYMTSQSRYYTQSRKLHYTAIPLENCTYVAILREDRYVEDDIIDELLLGNKKSGYYEIPEHKANSIRRNNHV